MAPVTTYSNPPPSRSRPSRPTLLESCKNDAVGYNRLNWALANLVLLLCPIFLGLATVFLSSSRFSSLKHFSSLELGFSLAYYTILTGIGSLSIAAMSFPRFFRYNLVVHLIFPRRRHRSHWSFMSMRRLRAICGKSSPPPESPFQIFVLGLFHKLKSIPVSVTKSTAAADIYQYLGLPSELRNSFYFTAGRRKLSWDDTMESHNLGALSHLHLRLVVPGGSKPGPADAETPVIDLDPDGSPSTIGSDSDSEPTVLVSAEWSGTEWIGTGKVYRDVPDYVAAACKAARALPASVLAQIPLEALPVAEFISIPLAPILDRHASILKRAAVWFSPDPPNCEDSVVWALKSIPTLELVRQLESDFSQSWLNGSRSIIDPSDPLRRLPLWCLTLFREILTLHAAQQKWIETAAWLPDADRYLLNYVAWNTHHRGAPEGQLDWTRLASDEWLSGGIVDEMFRAIKTEVLEHPTLAASTVITGLAFQFYITKFAIYGTEPKSFFDGILAEIQGGKTQMLFPIHYNDNHWMAFIIDFARRTFGFGDSYFRKSAPEQFISFLEQWLAIKFPGGFRNLGDVLTHARQTDFIHCGIYTPNTARVHLFNVPVLTESECKAARIEWFKKLIARSGTLIPPDSAFPQIEEMGDFGPAYDASADNHFIQRSARSLDDILNPEEPQTVFLAAVEMPSAQLNVLETVAPVEAEILVSASTPPTPPPSKPKIAKSGKRARDSSDEDRDNSDEERNMLRRLTSSSGRAKESVPRAKKLNLAERIAKLVAEECTVKNPDGTLKGTPHQVHCACEPGKARKLDSVKSYALENWYSHQKSCTIATKKKRTRTQHLVATPVAPPTNLKQRGIGAFFAPKKVVLPGRETAVTEEPKAFTIAVKKHVVADQRLDLSYFQPSVNPQNPQRLRRPPPGPPQTELSEEVECEGLHGHGYSEYAFQMGDSSLGGVGATAWLRFSPRLFPYKTWLADDAGADAEASGSDGDETIPEKVVRDACELTTAITLSLHGIPRTTNTLTKRSKWTDYEKRRLHQSLLVAARWIIHANSGSIFAKGCHRVTRNLDGTCSACTAVGRLDGLQRGIRRALARARLPAKEFAEKMRRRLTHTPLVRSEHAAAAAKAALSTPGVMKILTSKAKHGPVGVFLSLYQQSLRGDLDGEETFLAISMQLSDKVRRNKDPSGRLIHGIRYDETFAKYCTLMRSYGPRSGAQYDLLKGMTGTISQRQMRRRVAKTPNKLFSPELCAANLFPVVEFGERMKFDGPWICAGDGTKLRPLLTTSSEFSHGEKGAAHILGSTLPIADVLFKSAEEQSKIISEIEAAKAIASQVWVLALHIPLPNMPVFPVALIANKGKMTATEIRDLHLKLRSLCGQAGIKFLASGADGAKAESNAQQLMMNAETPTRLAYLNEKYGVFLDCPVYPDTGPHICNTDIDHGRKTARNNFLYGTHYLILAFVFLCHAVLMFFLTVLRAPLLIKDLFNPDKQDDGAARRLFTARVFRWMLDTVGRLKHPSLEGLFLLAFVLGELFDAWLKRDMPHIERVVCVFRARHFLTIWRSNIINAETRYPDLFPKQSSFLADSSFLILMRMCDQFILLILAHLEYYPNTPFMPWHHGTHFVEHFFGIARSFITDFSFGQFVEMYKHILIRQRILSSGQYSTKREKDSNNGYTFDFVDWGLKPEEIAALKDFPSRDDIDRACETAWNEAAALAREFAKMQIPELPLKPSDLHPKFRTPNGRTTEQVSEDEDEDSDVEDGLQSTPLGLDPSAFKSETVRIPQPTSLPPPVEESLPGSSLSVPEALAHAAHHVITEEYFAEEVAKDEAELDAIEEELERDPDREKTMSGRMLIANLLNPAPPRAAKPRSIPTFLTHGQPISRLVLADQRDRHCAETRVHSEADRNPDTDVEYLGGKFSLNHAAHHLKEAAERSEYIRNDTAFQKGRYRRWISGGKPVEWQVGCKIHLALGDIPVPNIKTRGVTGVVPLVVNHSLVLMRSALRMYLGLVRGIYRYGSVSGKHDSFTDAETVDGLSYLSLEVYEQLAPNRNIFQHVVPGDGRHTCDLALFTHAPISELVYHLSAAKIMVLDAETFSLSAGDSGWERWRILNSRECRRALDMEPRGDNDESSEDEGEYEEPAAGTKKRKPKPPRGAAKKPKRSVAQRPAAARKPVNPSAGTSKTRKRPADAKKPKK